MPEEEKKVEEAMPEEDKDKQQTPQEGSFAPTTPAQDEKKKPSPVEIMLYQAKKLKDIDEKLTVLIELSKKPIPLIPPVQIQQPTSTPAQATLATPSTSKAPASKLATVKDYFPEDLQNMLRFDDTTSATMILVFPKQFLGSENFAKIASVIRGIGGTYVSQGKESHFEVAKSK